MEILSVTSRGQVTLRNEVFQYLGIKPGEKIEIDLLPDGRAALRAATGTASIGGFIGLLAGKTAKVSSIDEINGAAAAGWAAQE